MPSATASSPRGGSARPPWSVSIRVGLLALLIGASPAPAATPNSLHTQGRVSIDGIPFSGTGRFRFALVDAAETIVWSSAADTNPVDGVPDGDVSLPVTRGLYAVQLGDGMAPLPPDLFAAHLDLRLRIWFDDGVHGVQLLSPDQPLAAVPYARQSAFADFAQAATAAQSAQTLTGPVPAAQLTGTIAIARLPDTVARLDSSPTFTGTVRAASFEGAGAVPWLPTSGAEVSTRPNTGIFANRDAGPVVVTLPASAQPGDVVRVFGAGSGGWTVAVTPEQHLMGGMPSDRWMTRGETRSWKGLALSADGRRFAAVAEGAPIAVSGNFGLAWTTHGPSLKWSAIASSADGTRLVAAVQGGSIWTSEDSGVHWTDRATTGNWSRLAASADGLHLIALESTGSLWNSADGGQTWTRRTPIGERWVAVASSADGLRSAAAAPAVDPVHNAAGAHLTTSEDAGNSWTFRDTLTLRGGNSDCVLGMSADGLGIVVGVVGGLFFSSSDFGRSWATGGPTEWWSSLAISADATRWIAGTRDQGIVTFTNHGQEWTHHRVTSRRTAVACSTDGLVLAAAEDGGAILVAAPQRAGGPGTFAEFYFLGDGLWKSVTPAALNPEGRLALAAVPDLPASRITSGVLDQARVPSLPAEQISSGILDPDRIPALPAERITSGILGVDRIPDLPAGRITSGFIAQSRIPPLPASRIAFGTLDASVIPANLPGTRTFDGPVGIGGYHDLGAPLGIRADSANATFGYCLSLHDRNNTPRWKFGVGTDNRFSLGASGLRDDDLSISRISGNVGIGATPYSDRKLRVAGDLSVDGTVHASSLDLLSDERLKTRVAPLTDSLARIDALHGIGFEWRSEGSPVVGSAGRQLGFLAQEVAAVLPDLVHTNANGILSMNYNGVTPVLVEALKELRHEVGTRLAEQAAALASKDAEIRDLRDRLVRLETSLGTRAE